MPNVRTVCHPLLLHALRQTQNRHATSGRNLLVDSFWRSLITPEPLALTPEKWAENWNLKSTFTGEENSSNWNLANSDAACLPCPGLRNAPLH